MKSKKRKSLKKKSKKPRKKQSKIRKPKSLSSNKTRLLKAASLSPNTVLSRALKFQIITKMLELFSLGI